MHARRIWLAATLAVASASIGACRTAGTAANADAHSRTPNVHYLEIVSPDVESLVAHYERVHGLAFGEQDRDLGGARVATCADGSLIGIRAPLAAHEQSIVRTYVAVDDIARAVAEATRAGAVTAYGPVLQGERGSFAIVFHGGVEHGLWQR